jgi:hypothetical protein
MNRYTQWVLWLFLGPALGLVQGFTSFLPVVVQHGVKSVGAEGLKTFVLISLLYGTAWLVPALLLADWIFLHRALRTTELRNYLGVAAMGALLLGLLLPGFALMIGFPLTAIVILGTAYVSRKQPEPVAGRLS